jgi:tRNA(fMet)-specific endonuclease VapC
MKVMLDTNICIYLIKEHPPSVLERFASHPVGDIGISVITLAELECGVMKSSRPARNRDALEQFVSP